MAVVLLAAGANPCLKSNNTSAIDVTLIISSLILIDTDHDRRRYQIRTHPIIEIKTVCMSMILSMDQR